MHLTGDSTSLAPGKASGGYGRSACSSFDNLGRIVFRGLEMILGPSECRVSRAIVRTASVPATEEEMTKALLFIGSEVKIWDILSIEGAQKAIRL